MSKSEGYIVVCGNIGVGKSTLVRSLATSLRARAALERPYENPWFVQAAAQPARWTLHAQLFFLIGSAGQAMSAGSSQANVVQERFPEEHVRVLARLHHALGRMTSNELSLLDFCLSVLTSNCPQPNLLIWLRLDPDLLLGRIQSRGRPEEAALSFEVLELLEQLYVSFFEGWRGAPVLELDTGVNDVRTDDVIDALSTRVREVVDLK